MFHDLTKLRGVEEGEEVLGAGGHRAGIAGRNAVEHGLEAQILVV